VKRNDDSEAVSIKKAQIKIGTLISINAAAPGKQVNINANAAGTSATGKTVNKTPCANPAGAHNVQDNPLSDTELRWRRKQIVRRLWSAKARYWVKNWPTLILLASMGAFWGYWALKYQTSNTHVLWRWIMLEASQAGFYVPFFVFAGAVTGSLAWLAWFRRTEGIYINDLQSDLDNINLALRHRINK
jgi:hypothetical protein